MLDLAKVFAVDICAYVVMLFFRKAYWDIVLMGQTFQFVFHLLLFLISLKIPVLIKENGY